MKRSGDCERIDGDRPHRVSAAELFRKDLCEVPVEGEVPVNKADISTTER